MKHLRILGLLAATAAATMACTSSASADYLSTSIGGPAATPTIHSVNENGHVVLANPIANIECQSTTEGTPTSHGAGKPVSGPLSSFSLTGCTNSWHVTISAYGSISIISSFGFVGIVVSAGLRISATRFGVTCNYETNNTTLGTLTGGSPGTLHIEASIPLAAGSSFLCGSGNAKLAGAYVTTSAVYVNKS